MDINAFKTQIKETVVQSMLDFMSFSDEDCGFTKEDVDECEAIFRGWEKGHGYKLLVSWIQAEDEDGRTNIIHLTEYRKNFMC